jgi:LacI family transcriptional regulator
MATINDVARLSGVSKMTVSRVINDSGYVKMETRERVMEAIKALNFRPNMVAKGLATRRNHVIAYMMIDISDPFHNLLSKGIETVCYERGYTTMICDIHNIEREIDYINMLADRQIDGAIFHHLDITEKQIEELENAGVKCVLVDNENKIDGVSSVDTDNYRGGFIAAKHLAEKGHTHIGCMQGVLEYVEGSGDFDYVDIFQRDIWKQRTQGFKDGMKKAGLKSELFYQGSGGVRSGFEIAQRIIKKLMTEKNPPTAMYCENDTMALGALSALMELKLDIPETMAIVGHDGLDISMMFYPKITTVVQPRYEMGYKSAEVLIDLIEGGEKVENIILEPELFIGDTT